MKNLNKLYLILPVFVIITSLTMAQKTIQKTADSNNSFAFDLYRQIAVKEKENIFISPFSISTALAMTYAGSNGSTMDAMAKTMHFEPNTQSFHRNFSAFILQLEKNAKDKIVWRVANKLWGESKYTFNKEFLELLASNYNSPLQKMNFISQPEECRKLINAWVEKATAQKIKNLIPQGVINNDTRLVLTNAVYFKADWKTPFKKENTRDEKFTKADKSQMMVPFMNYLGSFHHTVADKYKAIRLPYKGEKHSMLIVLPNDTKDLAAIEKVIDSKAFTPLFSGYMPEVQLSLPKFKATLGISLGDYLKQMGMGEAFSLSADFSKMTAAKDLCISEVIHKAFIEVDEKGTEAAAATAVVMMTTSCAPEKKPDPIIFNANRPFLFYIIDDQTQSILFMGRIMNPASE